jgi:uncharacterized protein
MNSSIPFIHPFRTLGGYYLFDVNTNAILPVKKETYIYLEYQLAGNGKQLVEVPVLSCEEVQNAQEWIKNVQDQGFLSSKRIKKIQHYIDPYLEGILDNYLGHIILQVTQSCNLRCKYCSFSGIYQNRSHSKLMMSEETAKKSIDFYIDHSSETPRLSFGFYGGEPFLNFDLIKRLALYIKQKVRGKKYSIFMTTNGTIINEEIVQFLVENDVNLFVSLDGPKEVHDRNRCFVSGGGSYDVVMKNIELAKKLAPEYVAKKIGFNAVFNSETPFCSLSRFFTDFEAIKDPLILASQQNEYSLKEVEKKVLKPEDLQHYDDLGYETYKNMLYRNGRLERQDVSKIVLNWEERDRLEMEENRKPAIEVPDYYHPSGPCIPGARRLFVTVNGDMYPCERVSETSAACKLGSHDTGIDLERAKEFLNIGCLTEEECKNCWAGRFCSACIACADNGEKMDKNLKLSYCEMFKEDAEAKLKKYCTFKEFNISTEKQYN